MTSAPTRRPGSRLQRYVRVCALAVVGLDVRAAAPYYDAEFDYVHDTNVSRGWREDTLEDDILGARVTASLPLLLGSRSGLLLTGGGAFQRYAHWEDLSEARLDARAVWRVKPGLTYDALWYEATAGAALLEHTGSALRDGGLLNAGVDFGRKMTDRLELRAGYRFNVRRAFDGGVFDTESHRLSAHADWRVMPALTAYAGFAWQTGGLVVGSRGTPLLIAVGETYKPDSALSTASVMRYAYRLDAETLHGELGINYALGQHWALDLSLQCFDSTARRGLHYDGLRLGAGALYRF